MENEYYVYVHRRADTGEPFYYGKGKGRRAWESYRNKQHSRVVAKHGQIVQRYRCLECELISNPAAIGTHHKFSGHKGKERVA